MSETITRNDLTNILNEVLPFFAEAPNVTAVSLPFTPPSNGLLFTQIRNNNSAGRTYIQYTNATPDLIDANLTANAYTQGVSFVKKDLQVTQANIANVSNKAWYFVPLDTKYHGYADMLDTFYPIGSYYETSDTNFDPNTAWGGTWELETEGQVHVSAGTNWPVSGAANNTTDGGAQNVTLTVDQIPSHNHGAYYTGAVSGTKRYGWFNVSGSNIDYGVINTGGGQAHNNMPPYIKVNRWHRVG